MKAISAVVAADGGRRVVRALFVSRLRFFSHFIVQGFPNYDESYQY